MMYSEKGDTVTLEMSRDEYATLIHALAMATIADRENKGFWIDFVNRLNAGNASFIPYEVPEEFKRLPWQKRHEEMGCVHPPGCVSCTWCGFGIL